MRLGRTNPVIETSTSFAGTRDLKFRYPGCPQPQMAQAAPVAGRIKMGGENAADTGFTRQKTVRRA